MDKKLIERIVGEEIDAMEFEEAVTEPYGKQRTKRIVERSLARIDAERVKDAVAFVDTLNAAHPRCVTKLDYRSVVEAELGVEYIPLFLSPTIPEGMVLMPVDPTPAMCDVIGNRYGAYETAEELYEALIAAAQGEQK